MKRRLVVLPQVTLFGGNPVIPPAGQFPDEASTQVVHTARRLPIFILDDFGL